MNWFYLKNEPDFAFKPKKPRRFFMFQEHLIGKDAPLFKALQSKHFPHAFFYEASWRG